MRHICRRDFLTAAGLGVASLTLPFPKNWLKSAFAKEGVTPSMVILYLRGGMDAMNVVVPYTDSAYYEMRPTIAIPRPGDRGGALLDLDGSFGLHPALGALKPFWDKGRLTPIVASGSPHPTRSHFDAQDFMEYAAPGTRTLRQGWVNRYLDISSRDEKGRAKEQAELRALAMQGLLPRALRGRYPVLAVPDRAVLADDGIMDLFGPLYEEEMEKAAGGGEMMHDRREDDPDDSVLATGRDTVATLNRFKAIMKDAESTRGGPAYPPGALGAKLRAVAHVIKSGEGLEVAAIDLGGWDTHANQGGPEAGALMSRLLSDLGDSIAAFMTDLGPALDRTLVVTMTEFGRTCRENGNRGTDHGHGGLMFVAGGGVKGGKVLGDWHDLTEKSLYQSRDLHVTTDFRDVFAAILTNHFRFKPPKDFFPDYKPAKVKNLFA